MDNLSPSARQAHAEMLEDIQDWQAERRAANLKYYGEAIAAGKVRTLEQEYTKHRATCDICQRPRKAGMRLLFLTGIYGSRFHVCSECMPDLMDAAPMNVLIAAQVAA
jgi:hypothetical protein